MHETALGEPWFDITNPHPRSSSPSLDIFMCRLCEGPAQCLWGSPSATQQTLSTRLTPTWRGLYPTWRGLAPTLICFGRILFFIIHVKHLWGGPGVHNDLLRDSKNMLNSARDPHDASEGALVQYNRPFSHIKPHFFIKKISLGVRKMSKSWPRVWKNRKKSDQS